MLKKKIGRLSAIGLSVALVITVFAGCGNSGNSSSTTTPTTPQIVKYNLGAEPKTIDPALNDAVDGATVIVNAFQFRKKTLIADRFSIKFQVKSQSPQFMNQYIE